MSEVSVEQEDWSELIRMLKDVEDAIPSLNGGNDADGVYRSSHQALQGFHTTAAMLGLADLESVGLELERCLTQKIKDSKDAEMVSLFAFAVNALMDAMKKAEPGSEASSVQPKEVLDILGMISLGGEAEESDAALADASLDHKPEPAPDDAATGGDGPPATELLDSIMEGPSAEDAPIDYTRLKAVITALGGKLSTEGSKAGTFTMEFHAAPAVVEQLETLLAPGDHITVFADRLAKADERLQRILNTIKDFIGALASRDMSRAESILLLLAEQQHQAGLYNEIGGLARELHNSLRNFMDTMDPALRDIVEDKIPDYGNRLEHILEVTEKAATITLDQVEILQKKNEEDQEDLRRIEDLLGSLRAVGEQAQRKLDDGRVVLDRLQGSSLQIRDGLLTILTAQDYQDLTGQVIQKIIKLLKDLELKLINVIRTFGVKVEGKKPSKTEELYGPAHKNKDALHSQDEVDNLLAEFGF